MLLILIIVWFLNYHHHGGSKVYKITTMVANISNQIAFKSLVIDDHVNKRLSHLAGDISKSRRHKTLQSYWRSLIDHRWYPCMRWCDAIACIIDTQVHLWPYDHANAHVSGLDHGRKSVKDISSTANMWIKWKIEESHAHVYRVCSYQWDFNHRLAVW